MIELVLSDHCTHCGACVEVCRPMCSIRLRRAHRLARVEDCQTCFMCELYCPADAIYVAPDCDRRVAVTRDDVVASGRLGQYRKHSGWGEWAEDFPNNQWLMETVFRRAGEAAARKSRS
jgi:MinD superfamily P-loop ATPase